ncbi:PQQ-dependent sugar dehydrogenase [Thalassotalea sp. LPB0316]|nr:PQQ-dependent sugar dehydrogenase [Thalassotalea sp. LPB0316]
MSLASCSDTLNGADIVVSPKNQEIKSEIFVENDGIPWGMAWLPNGDLLVTMRGGELRLIQDGKLVEQPITGLPEIAVKQQGGLLDIILHPNYADNGWLYLSYSKADGNGNFSTAIMRAKLNGLSLVEQQDIYVAQAYGDRGVHFGSRLAFDDNGYLYFSIGDRGQRDINPQDITRDAGKIYRIFDDGRIPEDNPFIDVQGAKKAIYSYGHRNPQGMAKHPKTGEIWTHEHGPKGGDEVNIISKGKNYGWPVISYGVNYSGTSFTELTEKEGMEQPAWYWEPSIAPSGMMFVTSDKYPQWQGNLLVGSMKFGYLVMLTLNGNTVVKEEVVKDELIRVRSMSVGPDGLIYLGIDGKGIYRLVP